jgi:hypothetical protein
VGQVAEQVQGPKLKTPVQAKKKKKKVFTALSLTTAEKRRNIKVVSERK